MMPAFVGGVIGALAVTMFRDDRVVIADYSGSSEMTIIRIDGTRAERRTRRFFIPTTPYTLVAPGKRSLTVAVMRPDQNNHPTEEYTIEVDVYKGLKYRLGRDQDKMPTLVVTKI
jgi:hypothetical protein